MKEYNLLSDYSKTKVKRFVGKGIRTIEHRIIASERERLFFDGDRNYIFFFFFFFFFFELQNML